MPPRKRGARCEAFDTFHAVDQCARAIGWLAGIRSGEVVLLRKLADLLHESTPYR